MEQPVELWTEVLRVNLIGPFLAIKHAAPTMVARGWGSIVLTASVVGAAGKRGRDPYAASKAGVVSLAQTAANSLSGTGVRVNAICPGLIETGMTKPIFDYARAKGTDGKIGQLNPLQRAGRPEEIAAMALFSPATNRLMSTARRSRSTAACRARIPLRRRGGEAEWRRLTMWRSPAAPRMARRSPIT